MNTTPMPVIASNAKQSSRSLQPPSYRHPGGAWLLLLQQLYNRGLPLADESRGPVLQSDWIPAFAGMTNELCIHSGLPRCARNDGMK
jgi:hypothetical protein